jgi:hypothetical protein
MHNPDKDGKVTPVDSRVVRYWKAPSIQDRATDAIAPIMVALLLEVMSNGLWQKLKKP